MLNLWMLVVVMWTTVAFQRWRKLKVLQMRLLVWLLLLTELEEMIFSTNDDPYGQPWSYDMDVDERTLWLVKEYTFWEMNPRSAIVCPHGFFLSTIIYHFSKPGQEEAQKKENKSPEKEEDSDSENTNAVLKIADLVSYMESVAGPLGKDHDEGEEETEEDSLGWNSSSKKGEVSNSQEKPDQDFDTQHALYTLDHLVEQLDPVDEGKGVEETRDPLSGVNSSDFVEFATAVNYRYGSCSTFVHCLGHQACLFHLSSDLCQNDPLPGFRKILNMQIKCERDLKLWGILQAVASATGRTLDTRLVDAIRDKVDSVVFIPPNKELRSADVVSSNYSHIKTYETREDEIFDVFCPSSAQAKTFGYIGDCGDKSLGTEVTSQLWTVLARTPTSKCREEIKQTHCAYVLNPSSECLPPFMIKPGSTNTTQPDWSFIAMPENGDRPDLNNYNLIFQNPLMGLIPVRIGFLIIAHQSPEVIMQLLTVVYRPQHFYVIHIDQRKQAMREALQQMITAHFETPSNIRLLPPERSFISSWGSFQVFRAELEAFEELLRMGIWDFFINFSGADVPLRNVDDIAASLAPYRGQSFVRPLGALEEREEPQMKVWHSCGGHVYDLNLNREPIRDNIVMPGASQWVVLSRSVVDYMVSDQREELVNRLQFRFQTMFISDEVYLNGILANSKLRHTIHNVGFTLLKPFQNQDKDNLCRHRDETDGCGQGPGTFEKSELPILSDGVDWAFFARKFNVDLEDEVRSEVLDWLHSDDYNQKVLGPFKGWLLNLWSNMIMKQIKSTSRDLVKDKGLSVTLRVLPRALPSDPCCEPILNNLSKEFVYWLEFQVKDSQKSEKKTVRASVVPHKPYQHACFPAGDIRLIHLTTQVDRNPPQPPPNDGRPPPPPGPSGLRKNSPLPVEMAGVDVIFFGLVVSSLSEAKKDCTEKAKENMKGEQYALWPQTSPRDEIGASWSTKKVDPKLTFELKLIQPDGKVRCHAEESLPFPSIGPMSNHAVHQRPIRCGTLEAGRWTVTLTQKYVDNPFTYSQSVLLSSPRDLPSPSPSVIDDLSTMWKVQSAVILEDQDFDRYYQEPSVSSSSSSSSSSSEQKQPSSSSSSSFQSPSPEQKPGTKASSHLTSDAELTVEGSRKIKEPLEPSPLEKTSQPYKEVKIAKNSASSTEQQHQQRQQQKQSEAKIATKDTTRRDEEGNKMSEARISNHQYKGEETIAKRSAKHSPSETSNSFRHHDSTDLTYFIMFGAIMIGTLCIFNLCVHKTKRLSEATRSLSAGRQVVLVVLVIVVQIVIYKFGLSHGLSPHDFKDL